MEEEERELLIKEIRVAVLNDVRGALAKLMDARQQDAIRDAAKFIDHYIGLKLTEVAQDKAGRMRLNS
jgi:alkyl hydroperoxide reductase subunit AhpC